MKRSKMTMQNDRGKMILVVDDDDITRDSYVDFLGEFGCAFVTACDGLEALEAYRKNKANIALIITDNNMPRMSGRELVTELRRTGETVPVIMISGDPDPELRLWTREIGLIAFIPKVINVDSLVTAVKSALAQH